MSKGVVRIRYSREGNTTTGDVEPVMVAFTNGHRYLIGWRRLHNDMRWLLVPCIERASATRVACSGYDVDEIGIPSGTDRPANN